MTRSKRAIAIASATTIPPARITSARFGSIPGRRARSETVIVANRATLDRVAAALVERESLDADELAELFGDAAAPVREVARARPVRPAPAAVPARAAVAASEPIRRGLRELLDALRRGPDVPEGLA